MKKPDVIVAEEIGGRGVTELGAAAPVLRLHELRFGPEGERQRRESDGHVKVLGRAAQLLDAADVAGTQDVGGVLVRPARQQRRQQPLPVLRPHVPCPSFNSFHFLMIIFD